MERREAARRLIVNADDFGRTPAINEAVIRSHREGILTTASLMVNEAASVEAVTLAKANPQLGVGLHLSLVCGRSALPQKRIPDLVNARGEFLDCPVHAGWRYFSRRRLRAQLRDEITAQFDRFRATGLPLDLVNGHLHLHLHPVVLSVLMENAEAWGICRMRLACDPFWFNARLTGGRWLYRATHAPVFLALSALARARLRRKNVRHTRFVFGLLQDGHVDETFVSRLIPALPPGDSELYSHPSLEQFSHEFDALISPRVKALIRQHDIQLIRYQDL